MNGLKRFFSPANPAFRRHPAAGCALLMLISIGTVTPVAAEERPCQISERPDGTLSVQEPVRDRVRGGRGRTRERAYITPPLEHDRLQLRLERTDNTNDGSLTICVYDNDINQATQVRVTQEQVWASNILSLTQGVVGESVETPVLEDMRGRRLLVQVSTPRSERRRSFSYRLSLQPASADGDAHGELSPEHSAELCKTAESRLPLPYATLNRIEALYPHEQQYHNPMPLNAEQVRVELEPGAGTRERRRSRGGILIICAERGADHPQGAGKSVRAIVSLPSGRDFSRDHPITHMLDGFYQAGIIVNVLPAPYESSRRSRWASRIARGGFIASGTIFTAGVGAYTAGGVAVAEHLVRSRSSAAEEDSKYPLVMRLRVEPIPGTRPTQEVAASADPEPEPQSETTGSADVMLERMRRRAEARARDEQQASEPEARAPAERRAQQRALRQPGATIARDERRSPAPAAQQGFSEDCIRFNPRNLEVQAFGNGARLLDGSHALMAFSSPSDANQSLKVIQHYGFNQSCYVGRPGPSMHYFLVNGNAPEGSMRGEDCLPINPDQVEVSRVQGSWRLRQGSRSLMDFGDAEDEALQALWVIRQHNFTRTCFVARPDPAMTYMRR